MPSAALKPCAHPGCDALVPRGYCVAHLRRTDQAYEAERATAGARGYGSKWRRLRATILRRDPMCRQCHRVKSRHVDHILAKEKGGLDVPSNLQGLCAGCHSRKTNRVDGGGWRGKAQ